MNFSRSRQSAVGPTPRRSGATERATPGPSRQSTSNNASRGGVAELPAYQVPAFSLNPAGQRALATLLRTHNVDRLGQTIADAQSALSNSAFDINDRLANRAGHLEQVRSKRRREKDEDEEESDDETFQTLEKEVDGMREKVGKMTSRMEQVTRSLIDGKQCVQWMKDSVNAAEEDARNNASTQATQTQRPRRTRRAAEDGEEDDEQEEEIEDFEPTDPGAGTQPERAPFNVFKARMEDSKTRFQTGTLNHRYAQDNDYINFRRTVHDAMHPNDEVPLPPPDSWFNDDGTVAPPGQTRRLVEDDADDPDDMQIDKVNISTRCVLTLREFEDVISSTLCDHSFEKSAIYEMIGRKGAVQCPFGGCKQMLSKATLKVDPVLVRKIKRLQKAKATQDDGSEDDDDYGGRTQGRAQLIDEDDDTEIGAGNTQPTQMKQEPRATTTQRPGPSQPPRPTQVIDLGESEDEEMADDQSQLE